MKKRVNISESTYISLLIFKITLFNLNLHFSTLVNGSTNGVEILAFTTFTLLSPLSNQSPEPGEPSNCDGKKYWVRQADVSVNFLLIAEIIK